MLSQSEKMTVAAAMTMMIKSLQRAADNAPSPAVHDAYAREVSETKKVAAKFL